MNSPRRCHPLMILDSTYRTVFSLTFFILLTAGDSFADEELPDDSVSQVRNLMMNYGWILFAVLAGLILITLTFAYLRWKNLYFYADESNFIVQRGVFRKTTLTLPFERINTVDLSQNLLHQMFNIGRLKLDSGSTEMKTGAEVDLILRQTDALALREYLLHRRGEIQEGLPQDSPLSGFAPPPAEPGFSAKPRDFIRLGLTSRKLAGFSLMIFALLSLLEISGFDKYIPDEVTRETLIVWAVIAVILIIASNIISVVRSVLSYWDFCVFRNRGNICISHGLISKKEFSLPVSKIHCAAIRQNLLQQLFGWYEISVTAMGYGDDKNETAMLFPIASRSEATRLLAELLPEFSVIPPVCKPAAAGYIIQTVLLCLLFSLPFAAAAFYNPLFLFAPLICIPIVLARFLSFRNTGFGMDETTAAVSYGAFTKTTLLIRRSSIQSVCATRGIFARRLGYFTAGLRYYGAVHKGSAVSLYAMPADMFPLFADFDVH